MSLDANTGVAYAGMAAAHRFARRNPEAEAALARALELNPYDSRVLRDAAFFNLYRGRYETALKFARRLTELDPGLGNFIVGVTLWPKGDLGGAHAAFQRLLSLSPNLTFAHVFSGWVHLAKGDRQNALQSLQLAERLKVSEAGGGAMILAILAMAYHGLDRPGDARRITEQVDDIGKEFIISDSARAIAYLSVDAVDEALTSINRAADEQRAGEDISEAVIAFNMIRASVLERPDFTAARKRLAVAQ